VTLLLGSQRTSSLDAPIMLLEGHEDGVNCVKFSPDGATLASAGSDKTLSLWNVRGDCAVRAQSLAPPETLFFSSSICMGTRIFPAARYCCSPVVPLDRASCGTAVAARAPARTAAIRSLPRRPSTRPSLGGLRLNLTCIFATSPSSL